MSKEEMEVVSASEEVKEEEVVELSPEEIEAKQKKSAMAAFILGLIAFLLCGWFGGLVGIICGAIALGKAKKAKGVAKNPAKIFRVLGLVFGILGLVFGIFSLIGTLILIFVVGPIALVGGIVAALYAAGVFDELAAASLVLLAL